MNGKLVRYAALGVLTLTLAAVHLRPAAAAPPPDWLNCPDAVEVDPRRDPSGDGLRIRQIAPGAGAHTSAELAGEARFARTAYEMYDAFADGKDPRGAFALTDQRLVAVVYGDPGPDTERRAPKRKDTRTLYGFVADEIATGRRTIAFRGTMQPAEWVRNAQALQRPFPSGTPPATAKAHVHDGFLKIFESLTLDSGGGQAPLAPALPGLTAARDVTFVGHSLGSAVATLAGVEAARRAPENAARMRIVTLASPRVGDAGFVAMASGIGRIDRVCNLVDVVTAVPASTKRISYVHVGAPFRVSSFDWPAMNNALEKPGDQILCWHGDQSYGYMLSPSKAAPAPAQCAR